MPYPETLDAKPKIIFFTDFDGTITLKDNNLGFGEQLRKKGNLDTLNGKITFRYVPLALALGTPLSDSNLRRRDSFWEMMESVKTPFPECIKLLCENIKLDPYFKDFYQWSRNNKVPVIVLSSGMTPIIRSLLVHLLGQEAEEIEIVSNEVVDKAGKTKDQEDGWQLKYHDDSGYGHDKSLTIRPYAKHFADRPNDPRPTMLYAGDGVSDLSAARETDLLFAKKGHDLITYCEREGIPFTVFEDWRSILATTIEIFEGKTDLEQIAAEGAQKAQDDKQYYTLRRAPLISYTRTTGHKIPAIENLGVAKDHDAIDFTDNDINSLSNFPLSPRLHTLLLGRNRVNSIQPTISKSIPNLTTLILTSNNIAELADVDALRHFPRLIHLSLLENPVTRKEVKDAERSKATELFGTVKEPSALASKIMGIKSRTFDIPGASATGTHGAQPGDKNYRVKLTEKEKKRVEVLIRNAKSLEEIARLEKELNEGRIPGGGGGDEMMED
ncbi:MAG: hypothetical protein Q9196_003850 [Gyalolechia fulgens]